MLAADICTPAFETECIIETILSKKIVENVRAKRATDYSYEDEEEEATAGSGSEANDEDEVSLLSCCMGFRRGSGDPSWNF